MLGNAATTRGRLIVWRLNCHHQVERDPRRWRYGTVTTISDCISILSTTGRQSAIYPMCDQIGSLPRPNGTN
jgi:hypothetical protein